VLLREQRDGSVLAIAQPAHAALAGRLAEAWDDDLAPDLVRATHHHDDVWAERDARPPFNPATGRPTDLLELGDGDRVRMWSRVEEVAAPLGPEAALWVLRHAERLHEDYDEAPVKAMAAAIGARIDERVAALRARGPRFDDAELARGTSLLALFDTLSLRLCFGVGEAVPAGVLRLTPEAEGAVGVTPWPFVGRRVDTFVEGRALPGRLADQEALDAAWEATAPAPVPVVLVPGG
jgi:hypothetical protein